MPKTLLTFLELGAKVSKQIHFIMSGNPDAVAWEVHWNRKGRVTVKAIYSE